MRLKALILTTALVTALGMPAAFAQSTSGSGPVTSPPTHRPGPKKLPNGKQIQQRKENQQTRIRKGVSSGKLSSRQTKTLVTQEHDLNKEEHGMASTNGGKLTNADRAKLTRQQNRLSKEISGDEHKQKDKPGSAQ